MAIPPWPILQREPLLALRVFELERLHARSPRTGDAHDFYVLHGNDWCNIVPLTDAGMVVMIRQWRHGTQEVTLEVPGGMVDPADASPRAAAERELLEETGYTAQEVEPLGIIHPNPAIQSHRCYTFVARGVECVAAPRLDTSEEIEVVQVPLAEIPARIAAGEVTNSLVVVAFAWLLGLRDGGP